MNNGKTFHPTLPKVQRDLAGFSDSIIMYVYHHLNGREEEGQSYLEEYKQEQESYANELKTQIEEVQATLPSVQATLPLVQSEQDTRIDN